MRVKSVHVMYSLWEREGRAAVPGGLRSLHEQTENGTVLTSTAARHDREGLPVNVSFQFISEGRLRRRKAIEARQRKMKSTKVRLRRRKATEACLKKRKTTEASLKKRKATLANLI